MLLTEKNGNCFNLLSNNKILALSILKAFVDYLNCLEILDFNYLFPKRQILDSSKLKEFADDNFRFDKNGRKFSKRVENTVRKRNKCSLRAISPFPTVFSKDLYCTHVKTRVCLGKGDERMEKIVEKGKKMLVNSIFSFSNNIFKYCFSRVIRSGDCDNGLNHSLPN